ncbi:MAG: dihydroxy-acid dehydratase, partial [Clostridia bacterium]|nr:dihydroxy-acid dehydratase [Clostridia bacterium]
VQEGDLIQINMPKRQLNVKLSEEEIVQRLKKWRKPESKVTGKSYLVRYASLVTSASTGAVVKANS